MVNSLMNLSIGIIMVVFYSVQAVAGNNGGAAFSAFPDTGQTACYSNIYKIACPAFGDFKGQDAQYKGLARSYTLLDGGKMIKDNVTGLVWENKNSLDDVPNYSNPQDADNIYTWCDPNTATNGGSAGTCGYHDTNTFIIQLNSGAGYGGYKDWRLPTIKELLTISDLGRYDPAIDPIFVSRTGESSPSVGYYTQVYYWSATTQKKSLDTVFVVKAENSHPSTNFKFTGNFVRAVRGGKVPPENRFINNNDGSVTDTSTCLQWQKALMDTLDGTGPDKYFWQDAFLVSENLILAGHADWRLPNRNEILSLVDFSENPTVGSIFENSDLSTWTSTTTIFGSSFAYTGRLERGLSQFEKGGVGSTAYIYVRAVRGETCVHPVLNPVKRPILVPIYELLLSESTNH